MQIKSIITCGTIVAASAFAGVLAGCSEGPNPFPGQGITTQYRDYIPMDAAKVAEAAGSVTYTAQGQGTTYIVDLSRFDQTTKTTAVPRVIGDVLLLNGQTLTIDGTAQTITVSGINNVTPTTVKNTNLKPDSTYQIFFEAKTR